MKYNAGGFGFKTYMLIQACHFAYCVCHMTTSTNRVPLKANYPQQIFCLRRQNIHKQFSASHWQAGL